MPNYILTYIDLQLNSAFLKDHLDYPQITHLHFVPFKSLF